MRILELDDEPFYTMPYERARSGGGIEPVELPFFSGRVERLPEGVDALVLASDLQGRVPAHSGYPGVLLGMGLMHALDGLSASGELPALDRIGALLAGDLYTLPGLAARGGLGDVREVWWTFGERLRWAAGVPGNHDDFGTDNAHLERFGAGRDAHVLNSRAVTLDGITVAGVAGIVGRKGLWHRPLREQVREVKAMLAVKPDVLVLHEGPMAKGTRGGQKGIRRALQKSRHGCLVIFGHRHWKRPLHELGRCQVLNLEARVVVLRA